MIICHATKAARVYENDLTLLKKSTSMEYGSTKYLI